MLQRRIFDMTANLRVVVEPMTQNISRLLALREHTTRRPKLTPHALAGGMLPGGNESVESTHMEPVENMAIAASLREGDIASLMTKMIGKARTSKSMATLAAL